MLRYYVNKNAQQNGDHEVHEEGCRHMPESKNKDFLGNFSSCKEAVAKAKETYSKADGCYYCCPSCHRS